MTKRVTCAVVTSIRKLLQNFTLNMYFICLKIQSIFKQKHHRLKKWFVASSHFSFFSLHWNVWKMATIKQKIHRNPGFLQNETVPASPWVFLILLGNDEGSIVLCPRASSCLHHHRVAHAASPCPAGVFPWCSGAAQCATDLRAGGTDHGLAGRCNASWHVAESVVLRGWPGTHTKKKHELISAASHL